MSHADTLADIDMAGSGGTAMVTIPVLPIQCLGAAVLLWDSPHMDRAERVIFGKVLDEIEAMPQPSLHALRSALALYPYRSGGEPILCRARPEAWAGAGFEMPAFYAFVSARLLHEVLTSYLPRMGDSGSSVEVFYGKHEAAPCFHVETILAARGPGLRPVEILAGEWLVEGGGYAAPLAEPVMTPGEMEAAGLPTLAAHLRSMPTKH